jgi:hypothetical protein
VSEYSELSEFSEVVVTGDGVDVVTGVPGVDTPGVVSVVVPVVVSVAVGTMGFSRNRFFIIDYLLWLREVLGGRKKGTLTEGEAFGVAGGGTAGNSGFYLLG